jgi:hypothetical protein
VGARARDAQSVCVIARDSEREGERESKRESESAQEWTLNSGGGRIGGSLAKGRDA